MNHTGCFLNTYFIIVNSQVSTRALVMFTVARALCLNKFLIKFGYNARFHWLKERALSGTKHVKNVISDHFWYIDRNKVSFFLFLCGVCEKRFYHK